MGQVVGNGAPDHAATHDHDPGPLGQLGESHRHNLAPRADVMRTEPSMALSV